MAITWNPSDKSSGISLTGSNYTATDNTNSYQNVRATTGFSTGKYYWELTCTATTANQDGYLGIMISTESISTSGRGTNTKGLRYTPTSGDVYGVAVDFGAGKVWIRTNGGAWSGGGDPVAGTTPTATFTPGGTWFPWWGTDNITDHHGVTLTAYAADFADAAPTGYDPLDVPPPAVIQLHRMVVEVLSPSIPDRCTCVVSNAVSTLIQCEASIAATLDHPSIAILIESQCTLTASLSDIQDLSPVLIECNCSIVKAVLSDVLGIKTFIRPAKGVELLANITITHDGELFR